MAQMRDIPSRSVCPTCSSSNGYGFYSFQKCAKRDCLCNQNNTNLNPNNRWHCIECKTTVCAISKAPMVSNINNICLKCKSSKGYIFYQKCLKCQSNSGALELATHHSCQDCKVSRCLKCGETDEVTKEAPKSVCPECKKSSGWNPSAIYVNRFYCTLCNKSTCMLCKGQVLGEICGTCQDSTPTAYGEKYMPDNYSTVKPKKNVPPMWTGEDDSHIL